MPHPPFPCKGFTLIELIVVIAVVGILAGIVAVFIRNPLEGYMAASRRAELVDAADTALLRMHRDIHAALPNSLRVTTSGGAYYLEFLPLAAGGRYRTASDGSGSGDPLDFADGSDAGFDILGPAISATPGQYLVIFNLGQDAATDAWQGGNRRVVTSSGSVSQLSFSATGSPFPLASPNHRFFITHGPVSYVCDPVAGTLTRHTGYEPGPTQPTSPIGGVLVAHHVQACQFSYNPGAAERLGQLTLWLQLGKDGESVSLYREVAVDNDA
jgi:MSHA biogenesis protein MshO